MSKPIVRCRCGHQVLAKEVLRTDVYERPRGRDYVYVKFRCRRCKRLGEAFVAENRWDWSILEPEHNEMSDAERDVFLDRGPISAAEVLDFHCRLRDNSPLLDLSACAAQPAPRHDKLDVPGKRDRGIERRRHSKPDPSADRNRMTDGPNGKLRGAPDDDAPPGETAKPV